MNKNDSAQNRLFKSISCVIFIVIAVSQSDATVIEFGIDGHVTITGKSAATDEPGMPIKSVITTPNAPADQATYRKLARDVATKYSGSKGVRMAGLNALSFIDVFEALIHQESNFDPSVVSPKGAVGLGQLMPDTANALGVKDRFDPVTNLNGSAKYFTQQLEQFGSLDLALAAYNAGPERVIEYNGIPPISETKIYIKRILAEAGLKPSELSEQPSLPSNNQPQNPEAPLKGEISVWEF
ncbi:MAG: lytic transglycosylase domain-containing protein [Rhizobiaceae bacterium]